MPSRSTRIQQISELDRLAKLLAAQADRLPRRVGMPTVPSRESVAAIAALIPRLKAACQALDES
jgi:hypothetical protein